MDFGGASTRASTHCSHLSSEILSSVVNQRSTKCLRSTNEVGSCGDMLVDDAVTCCASWLSYVFKSISV
jgi:hypothetical protein